MTTFLSDLRYGLRLLFKRPGFTAAAILSLALGIGANTTVFTWIKAVALTPLPAVPDTDHLVVINGRSQTGELRSISYPDFVDYRDRAKSFSGLICYRQTPFSLGVGDQPERVWGSLVSGNYFDVLSVKPVLGRSFLPEEDRTLDTHPVVVISNSLWRTRFAADPNLPGKTITLNGRSFTVVGVAPEGFTGSAVAVSNDVWVPMMMMGQVYPSGDQSKQRGNRWLSAMARLKPGVAIDQAQAEMRVIGKQLEQEFPQDKGLTQDLNWIWKSPTGASKVLLPILIVLMIVVALVLLIACANVANLLLARAAGRQKEIAIRLSMGAGRGRLIRQLLTESILLSVLGGGLGVLMAYWSKDMLMSFMPPINLPISLKVGIDGQVFGFAFVLALVTGIIFGVVPALQASKPDIISTLKDESGAVSGGGRKTRLLNALVIAQVSLSLLLLIGAGLFLRSLQNADNIDLGFQRDHLLLASVDLFPNGYNKDRGLTFYSQLLTHLEALPGLKSVSLARKVPLGFGGGSSTSVEIEGYVPQPNEEINIEYNNVGPNYFRTMGMTVVQGREFNAQDRAGSQEMVIINETFARRYFPNQDSVGRVLNLGSKVTIAGVVRDGKYQSLTDAPKPYMFLPLLQNYRSDVTIHVKTDGDTLAVIPGLRKELASIDPALPVFDVKTMEEHMDIALVIQRVGGTLLSIFGGLALILSGVGIYGIISFFVSQRTHEMGIRMALGAKQSDVLKLVVGRGMYLAAIGIGIGLVASFGLSRFMKSFLLGISTTDPLTFIGFSAVLAMIAFLACYLPARRATKVDPLNALRSQ